MCVLVHGPAAAMLGLPWPGPWPLAAGETPIQNGEEIEAQMARTGRCARSLCPGAASTMAREFMFVIWAATRALFCWAGDAGGSTLLSSW